MPKDEPIELYGFNQELNVILARRSGEPSFVWVQDLADAYQAAASRGGVDITISRALYDQLSGQQAAPEELRGLRIV